MRLNQIFSKPTAEVKLLDFFVEDEGCPHIFFTAHTPIQFLHPIQSPLIDVINIRAKVFICGADQMAIDGYIVEVSEEFNFAEFQKFMSISSNLIDNYLNKFKAKLKLELFKIAQSNDLLDGLENTIFEKCLVDQININEVPIINNATRAIVLMDKALNEFKKFLEMILQISLVDQI
ncbi:hypothetical protein ACQWTT_001146 [Acinetobacter baumannii]